MLTQLLPRGYRRYSSLPLFGNKMNGFAIWLLELGYLPYRVRHILQNVPRIDQALWQQGYRSVRQITRDSLEACAPQPVRINPNLAATVHNLQRYLEEIGILVTVPAESTRSSLLVEAYRSFLENVRGLSNKSVVSHLRTAGHLFDYLGYEKHPACLVRLGVSDLEAFVCVRGRQISRASLQHEIAYLRSLLRFLAMQGETSTGIAEQIDTPRIYRHEKLPRALPWETVVSFLRSIDRSTARGFRDYVIFLLMATYGLRVSEIVTLTLDDIDWRAGRICLCQRKNRSPLVLPLTDTVRMVLVDYLQRGRPALPRREIFLRSRHPGGALARTAVSESFKIWLSRSGLSIPSQGPHCLRHSYAVHLLRQGTPIKTIGDLLGHHSAESTCVYLRLAIEDLRDVALSLPDDGALEVQP